MDRDELEERIRMRRPGDAPFRRGSLIGGEPHEAEAGPHGYQPFRPEPEDARAVRESDLPASGSAHVDHTAPGFDQRRPPLAAAPSEPPPPGAYPEPPEASVQYLEADEPADDDAYPYYEGDFEGPRRSGGAALPIVGFVALCALALAVGVVLSGMLGGPEGVGQATPSASVTASQEPTPEPTTEATESATTEPSGSPGSSDGPPVVFPDGFSAETQPCAEQPTRPDGCDSSGSRVSGGSVWVWVGFEEGDNDDVLGVTIVDAAGSAVGDGSIELRAINCGRSCSGYVRFQFGGLAAGDYTIRVNRNGHPAAEADFAMTA